MTNRRTDSATTMPRWILRIGAMQRLSAALAAGVAAFFVQPETIAMHTRAIATWDIGVLVYLCLAWSLIVHADASTTRGHALGQDQSGYVIFLFVVVACFASIVAIGFVVGSMKGLGFWSRAWHLSLTIAALISCWLMIQTVFAFHYARRYYGVLHHERSNQPALVFPGGRDPDYLDFAYYAFVIGMTSQVSDVAVASRQMRRLTLTHSALAFVFNIAVLALAINIIGSVV